MKTRNAKLPTLYVIDVDETGNYRVACDGYSAPIWRRTPFRLHLRRQQYQGRFNDPAAAVHRAAELADAYSRVKG